MSLSSDEIKKIAHLARLKIQPEKMSHYAQDLSGLLALVAQMNALETTDILPMAHPLNQTQRFRVDEVTEINQRDLFQSLAPAVDSGLYLVPKVIE
jgi:aspartyl-tRNA(Asn)/glutamyl-tRNA(Gln) amidotransferase subunit C